MVFGGGDEFGTSSDLVQKHPGLGEHIEVEEIVAAELHRDGAKARESSE